MQVSPYLLLPVVIAFFGFQLLAARWNAYFVLREKCLARAAPGGTLLECEVRFPEFAIGTPCVAQGSDAGLYLASTDEQVKRWNWTSQARYDIKKPVLVPWADLEYRYASFPAQGDMRFDLKGTKATFFIRKDVAIQLLQMANRPLPLEWE